MSLESAILELASSIRLLATSQIPSSAATVETSKLTKGAKVKTTTPPPPAVDPPATEPEAPADAGKPEAPATEAPALSAVEIRAKVTALIQAAGRDAGIGLLKKFKAQAPAEAGKPPVYNASSLKPEHYAAFATEADELIAATK